MTEHSTWTPSPIGSKTPSAWHCTWCMPNFTLFFARYTSLCLQNPILILTWLTLPERVCTSHHWWDPAGLHRWLWLDTQLQPLRTFYSPSNILSPGATTNVPPAMVASMANPSVPITSKDTDKTDSGNCWSQYWASQIRGQIQCLCGM